MARLRAGRANTARGAAHFLRETLSRVRHAGATGQLTVRADSGFYRHRHRLPQQRCPLLHHRPPVQSARSHRGHTRGGQPIPYWMEGAADVAETTYTPGSQLALFASYSYHAFITDREGDTLELEADHRRHAEIENAIRDLKYGVGLNHLPSGRFAANAAWMAVQVLAHNLARWTSRIGLGEQVVTTRTLRRRFFALAGRLTRSARRLTLHLPQGWPWGNLFSGTLARLRSLPASDGGAGRYANLILIDRPDQGLLNSRPDRRRFPAASGGSVGAPHPCQWLSSDPLAVPPTRNPPGSSRSRFHPVPLQHCHNVLRWIQAKGRPACCCSGMRVSTLAVPEELCRKKGDILND